MAGGSKAKGASGGNGEDSKHFAPGDVVLGKIKGYPPWPGILMDEDNVPRQKVLKSRPGKNYFIVRFFPAADYGFNKTHELRKLHKREIEAYLSDPHKKAADLRAAYEIAMKPEEWNEEQNRIVRKAEEAGDDEEDMLEEEEEEAPTTKKRKTQAGQGQAKKAKLSRGGEAASGNKKTPVKSSGTPRKSVGAEDGEGDEAEMDPETKKVRGWRHSLQRSFLTKTGAINANDMESMNKTLKMVEEYSGINADVLRTTKIGKVMRRIVQLSEIPRNEEFSFKERAEKLCDKWAGVFSAAREAGDGSAPPPSATIEANGSSEVKGETDEKLPDEVKEESTASAPLPEDESVLSVAPL